MPVVGIPGTLCAPEIFDRLAAALPGGSDTVDAVDWLTAPGPWRIEDVAASVSRRIEALGEPVTLLGHSTGGCVAATVAATRPDLVSHLLLANTGAHMRGHGDVDRILTTITEDWGPSLHAAVLDRSFATPLPSGLRTRLLAYAARVPPAAVLEVLTSQRDLDLTPKLASITCPATVLHGSHDRARSVADARYLAEQLPDCELTVVATGHTPFWEDVPSTVAALERLRAR
ncbi:alpha/beta fold hydrolase [Amycolatopsis jiangsuensis]|uniref:3-oxoadipate enol-lactonase n=1 Tax=Amycolatopsis jiangsuensis TaxID=1181879 RepID=A0A840IXM7_9PSEU|nr:alpha/beta hydrolase [Amycolatopsis jiangsuensis]MBB4686047.1 3-oxoadipate enol-lactonase [Amycolatopsis jiangsuensis]